MNRNNPWRRAPKRCVFLLIALLLVLTAQGSAVIAAAAEMPASRTIRVVMDNNYPPYIFVDGNGSPQGILVDQWRLWQQKTGIRVELTTKDWKDALADMQAGTYDVIDTVFKTKERLEWLDFGVPYARLEVAAFFNQDISGITDVRSLQGFAVAVKEGDAAVELLRNNGVDNLVLFKGYEAIVQAAKEHKVNVFVIDKPPGFYFLYKYGVQQSYKVSPPLNAGEFHRAVRKGNAALLAEVESGFARISRQELEQIENKWYGESLLDAFPVAGLLIGAGVLGMLILLLFYWNRTLSMAVRKRTAELGRSEEALRSSEARYRELIEKANSIILRMDCEGRICFLNEFGQRFFGYAGPEVIGQNVVGTIVPENDSAGKNLRAMIADLGRRPEYYSVNENENMRRDGTRVWISWTNTPLCDAAGGISEILCVGNDITGRKRAEEALRRERERLEFVIAGSRLGTWEWNVQNNETVFNEIWAQILGYMLAELMPYSYETWKQLVHPDDLRRAEEALARCVKGEVIDYDCEFRMRHKDGHWVWILDRGRVVTRDGEGRPLSMFGTHTDITTIKRAEEELQASNDLLSLFVKHSPIHAYIKEVTPTESRVLKASDNFQDMIGIPASEMLGKTMHELFPAAFAAKITEDDWQVASRGEILQVDEDLNGRSYTTIKFPIQLGEKNLLAGYTIDLTDSRRAEAALLESEATFRNIVQATPMGIHLYQLQPDGRLVFAGANPAADTLLGLDNAQFVGMTPEEAFPPLRDTELPERYRRAAVYGEHWQAEHTSCAGSNTGSVFEVHAFQMSPGKVVVLFNEITARKRAEEEKDKLQAQLTQAQKMESIGRLAGGVAHDFNNMLSVILGHSELALAGLTPSHPLYGSLQNICKAAERSADLTRQLLAFARKQTAILKVLDLNETVQGMLDMLRRLIGEDIELAWLPGGNLGKVNMDASQIDQILVNLFLNARDAIGDTGKVTIETAAVTVDERYCAGHPDAVPGEYVLLAVSDNGCGMDAGMLSQLFEPFFTTKAVGKGTGLGLATVYGIVKQNNGFIMVYSEPGQGTTFKVYLPRHTSAAGPETDLETASPAESGSETILLVEDEPMILDMVAEMLQSLGYNVLPTVTPGEAMHAAREHAGDIHLVVTDVIMPEMNGRVLCRNLLALYPHLKCVYMSGYTANVIAHHGVLNEGVHFVQKPFTLSLLAATIREALDVDAA